MKRHQLVAVLAALFAVGAFAHADDKPGSAQQLGKVKFDARVILARS